MSCLLHYSTSGLKKEGRCLPQMLSCQVTCLVCSVIIPSAHQNMDSVFECLYDMKKKNMSKQCQTVVMTLKLWVLLHENMCFKRYVSTFCVISVLVALSFGVLERMCLCLSLKTSPAGMNKVYWMELNAIGLNVTTTEANWNKMLKATCSKIISVFSRSNTVYKCWCCLS